VEPADAGIDLAGVLELNRGSEAQTSPLDAGALRTLLAQAFHVGLRDAGRTAVLIALDQDADYASPNFHWFRERYPRFVYVDRIIVGAAVRGRGSARSLYEELFAVAQRAGHAIVCCEVNLVPPNPGSQRLHAALGFEEVGRAAPYGTEKLVQYLLRPAAQPG
jgi:predicted GNAT superfamily acetyltransferase